MTKQSRRVFLKQAAGAAAAVQRAAAVRPGRCQQPDSHGGRRLQRPRQKPHRRIQRSAGRAVRLRFAACSAKAAETFDKKHGRKLDQIADFRQLLDRNDIDAISIATPNHTHSLIAILAAQAGKDVYVEKPVSHGVWEGRQLVNAAERHKRIIQCGTQARSHQVAFGKPSSTFTAASSARSSTSSARATSRGRRSASSTSRSRFPKQIDYDLWCGPAAKVDLYRPERNSQAATIRTTIGIGTTTPATATWATRASTRWISPAGSSARTALSPRVVSFGGRLGYDDAGNTANTQVVLHDYADAPLIFETRGLPKSKAAQKDRTLGALDG